ncbi:MAG: Swt1 family HEPN domain-containing protein [Patescibacteria group bacterium]|nr:Swt1 family HEPN domain-containing protein [Patescibacteria group bacterium]
MKKDFENPFANYGNIVWGDRFIGRKDDMRVVENRIIRPKEPGNLAIIGEYRIGKSSLIYKALMERKDELTAQNLLPIWINLGIYEQVSHFFRSLVIRCVDEMKDLNWITKNILRSADLVLDEEQSWSEEYFRIQRFFEKVRQAGYRVLFIFDEFDHARHLFKGDISGFQKLRELSYRPEWQVTYVSISRRSIREIELQTRASSTLDGIFLKHYLEMFNNDDVQEYFRKLSSTGLVISSDDKNQIAFYCDGHPYLLEMLGYEIVEIFREEQKVDVDETMRRIEQSFVDHYDHVVELLREDGSFNKLLQILFGPVVDAKRTDVDKFLKYGLIKAGSQGVCVGFSEHFHNFLNMVQRDVDLWPIWSDAEKMLRHLITNTMLSHYGDLWIAKLEKAHPKLKVIFDRCREAQKKEEKAFGSRAADNLIDFTYPQDLFAIIFAEWNIFNSIFGKDKNYWDQRNQLLAKIRNPLAHNRDDALDEYERQIAEGYCKEILSLAKR